MKKTLFGLTVTQLCSTFVLATVPALLLQTSKNYVVYPPNGLKQTHDLTLRQSPAYRRKNFVCWLDQQVRLFGKGEIKRRLFRNRIL